MLRILRHYWRHLRHFPHYWVPVVLMAPIASVLAHFAPPFIVARVIDRLSAGPVPLGAVWDTFRWEITAFVVAVVVGELIMWRVMDAVLILLEARMVERLFADCFRHLTSQSAPFFADRFVGAMVSSVNKFVSGYVTTIDTLVFQVLPLLAAVTVTIVAVAGDVPLFAVGVAVVTAGVVLVTVVSYSPLAQTAQRWAETHSAIGGRVADVLSNVLVVKSFAREAAEHDDFAAVTAPHRAVIREFARRAVGRDAGLGTLLVGLLTLAFASILVAQASGVAVGTLVVMLTFGLALFGYLWEVPRITRMYNRVLGDATPMAELFEVTPAVADPARPQAPRMRAGAIRFDRVTFAYPGAARPVFERLTLDIGAGERVGLVGPSGSGKSSLTRVLMRFFDVQEGAVTVDGQDVRAVTQAVLRSHIAYVPQEPLLFHRTVAENIRYGRPSATDAEVRRAADRARVLEFAADLADGLGTLVGERGVKLSGGQRQRIAIARAILAQAPILVLDEATSALDSLSEAHIQRALDEAMEGRTTIAIAHRLSTLRSMTRLVVLDGGRVIEQGTHDTLLSGGGVYAAMWRQQSGGFVQI